MYDTRTIMLGAIAAMRYCLDVFCAQRIAGRIDGRASISNFIYRALARDTIDIRMYRRGNRQCKVAPLQTANPRDCARGGGYDEI